MTAECRQGSRRTYAAVGTTVTRPGGARGENHRLTAGVAAAAEHAPAGPGLAPYAIHGLLLTAWCWRVSLQRIDRRARCWLRMATSLADGRRCGCKRRQASDILAIMWPLNSVWPGEIVGLLRWSWRAEGPGGDLYHLLDSLLWPNPARAAERNVSTPRGWLRLMLCGLSEFTVVRNDRRLPEPVPPRSGGAAPFIALHHVGSTAAQNAGSKCAFIRCYWRWRDVTRVCP